MKRVALHNLGCKVNAYEMDIMQQNLQENGFDIVPFDEMADIYIVNTCTVTNIADRKSRQMLHQAKKRNPDAVVVAVGCYVQMQDPKTLKKEGIDLAIGNNRKKDLVPILNEYLMKQNAPGEALIDMNDSCDYEEMTLKHTAEHTRAYIKIQDGCNQFCSYCIIPFARGRVRSRKYEDIRKEMEGLAAAGYKEVVLTGIHISSYGIDFSEEAWENGESVVQKKEDGQRDYAGSSRLIDLLSRLQDVDGIERIRVGSLEPRIITEDAVKRMAAMDKLCPHFHLSLQSGCDETLQRMNRHYTTGEYLEGVERLRKAFDHPAVTTDVIVGFPGETQEEFLRTEAFLQKADLYEMHVFKYSRRKGTRAADMPGQVPGPVQSKRSERLLAMTKECSHRYREYYIGRTVSVLFEEEKEIDGVRYQIGHSREYVKVGRKTDKNLSGQILSGKITDFLQNDILLME